MFVLVSKGYGDQPFGAYKFDILPSVGDTILVPKNGFFRVLERVHFCDPKKNQGGALIVEEIEGVDAAPSGRYDNLVGIS